MCKTKPNLEGLGYVGKGRRQVWLGREVKTCKTNPIWPAGHAEGGKKRLTA
jgi:hypothetical protein